VIGPLHGIDHVIAGTDDLEATRALWTRLGFTLSPRGRHKGWGTGNYCAMFANDYVELLGMVDPAGFDNGLAAMLAKDGPGLLGFALAAGDAYEAAAWLATRGMPHTVKDLSRYIELPDGNSEPRFALAMPDRPYPGGLTPFVTGHLTRDLVWRPEWTRHANGVTGISSITYVTDDPLAMRDGYEAIFGLGSAVATDETLAVRFGRGGGFLMFVKPADMTFLHPAVAADEPVRMGYAGLTLTTADIDTAIAALKAGGIEFDRDRTGAVHLPPDAAGGLALSFVAN
jgi:catechol 2,3-dioxygenase-like lactoylglutathione lyase family enzyme